MSLKHLRLRHADASLTCPECHSDDGIVGCEDDGASWRMCNLFQCRTCQMIYLGVFVPVIELGRPVSMRWETLRVHLEAAWDAIATADATGEEPSDDELAALAILDDDGGY